jgi:formate-dependent nitrite reductase membrane component NrfD
VVTKAIAAGAILLLFIASAFDWAELSMDTQWWGLGLGLFFLAATGLLLIKDLDRPDRFLNVLLRPQWGSWLVKGGYTISVYGGLLTLWGVTLWFGWTEFGQIILWATAVFAVITAVYTAFLFAQAKGRDFWQSPTLALHMLIHSFMAGAGAFSIVALFTQTGAGWLPLLRNVMAVGIIFNLLVVLVELTITHPTADAKKVVKMITKGRYRSLFWGGAIIFGNLLPLVLLLGGAPNATILALSGLIILMGIYFTEHIWVEAPQRIPLS